MLCLICPTATSCAVITGKLGGDIEGVTTYTMLINLVAALLIPAVLSVIAPHGGQDFGTSFAMILARVFPMLICPFLAAWAVRLWWARLHRLAVATQRLRFLSLGGVPYARHHRIYPRSDAHRCARHGAVRHRCCGFAGCVVQFALGRRIGQRIGEPIAPAQALGQKNTVFAIWAGYTFFDPVSSIAGGFYSIFHNVWNSYQLSQNGKRHLARVAPEMSPPRS